MLSPAFRRGMAWLHLWAGLVLGLLLILVFFMGTLSVYDREIDRWMMPETRLALPAHPLPLDTIRTRAGALFDTRQSWYMLLPGPRTPFVTIAGGPLLQVTERLDPATGQVLPDARTLGGSGFFFPLHYELMIQTAQIGLFVVAFLGMAMLALLVSGVVIHRGVFKKLFTLRTGPPLRRFSLDLHALTGVAALPFHAAIVVTGLAMVIAHTMPAPVLALFDSDAAFDAAAYGAVTRTATGEPAPQASLDAMLARAQAEWGNGRPFYLHLFDPGDHAALVSMRRLPVDHLGDDGETIWFDGATGARIGRATPRAAVQVASVLAGAHLLQVESGALRLLYFLAGLAGTAMIATGFVLYAEKRRDTGAAPRLVDAICVASTLGLLLATAAYLLTNRLVPPLPGRPTAEIMAFSSTWALSMIHALLARAGLRQTWQIQALLLAALALVTVLANWLSTGTTVAHAYAAGQTGVAGVDVALLATAGLAALFAIRLRERPEPVPVAVRRRA